MSAPDQRHVGILAGRLAITHRLLLEAAEACTDADLAWRPGPASPPIAFHLWYCGRLADRWAEAARAATGSGGSQRWQRENLAERWRFTGRLGGGDSGIEVGDEEAAFLPFPGHSELATYLRGACNDLEQVVATLDDASVLEFTDDLLGEPVPLAESLTRHLAEINRQLGMIEASRALRGDQGTATA